MFALYRPFVTGSSFWKQDGGHYYNDGAFAGLLRCMIPSSEGYLSQLGRNHHSLLLPWSFDLLSRGLNILLGREKAIEFWEEGLKKGVNSPNLYSVEKR